MPTLPSPYTERQVAIPAAGGRRASTDDFYVPGISGKELQNTAESILARTEHEEQRKALISSSELRAKYARALDEAATSEGDLDKLKEEMQAEMAKVGENFQTKAGSDAIRLYEANTDLMFDEQANRIKIQRAGAQARVDSANFVNSASAVIQSNPQYLPAAEKDANALISTFSKIPSWMRTELADNLKKNLNMAAATAAARNDPEQAKKDLEAGKWNLSSEQRNTAINRADQEIRSRQADDARIKAEARAERIEKDEDARDKYFKQIINGDPKVRRAIMDDPALGPRNREHLFTFMEMRAKALAGEERRSDQKTLRDLTLSFMVPEGDPRKAYNASAAVEAFDAGLLNVTDFNRLVGQANAMKDENNRSLATRVGGLVQNMGRAFSQDPRYIGQPELVASIQNEYVNEVWRKVEDARRANKNPADLLDSDSKDYVGSAKFISGVVSTAKAKQQAAMPQVPDLRKVPEAWRDVSEGATFVDPKGVSRVMTKELKAALEKNPPVLPKSEPFRTSGEKWPRDRPMSLSTYRYRKAAGFPIDKGLTVVDENGQRVPENEL